MFKTINDDYRLKSAEKCEIPLVLAKVNYNDCEVKNIDDQKESDEEPEFSGPITSIIQSKKDKNILMTCENGTVNLFSIPNLEYFRKLNNS